MTWFSSDFDRFDLDYGKLLAVALLALVALALLLLEYDHFASALVLKDLGRDRGAGQRGPADPEVGPFTRGQHVRYLDGRAGLRVRKAVHHEDVPLGYDELLLLGLDLSFHEI